MATPQRPTVRTDPEHMPLTECHGAAKVSIKVKPLADLTGYQGDAVVFVCRGSALPEEAAKFDAKLGGLLAAALNEADFKGDADSCISTRVGSGGDRTTSTPTHLVAVGTADHKTFDPSLTGSSVAATLKEKHLLKSVALYIPDLCKACPCPAAPKVFLRKLQAVIETLLVELTPDYRFKGTGSKSLKTSKLETLTIFAADVGKTEAVVEAARRVAAGVHLARELVSAPANFCTTETLANAARQVADDGRLECEILDLEAIEKLGMGSYLAVAKGSIYPPKFIHLTYVPLNKTGKEARLAFVGKGLCFDSGGYNLKRSECSIELMKFDMGGAAAVLGAAKAIGLAQPSGVIVHFIVAAAENMVSSRAYRPGDIIRASNGKTIEVGNTDAEGRLTLADALVFAENLGVDAIVDVATLTGACIVALGESFAGLWSSQDDLAGRLLKCADRSGEKVWRMPLVMRYREMLDSKLADINNVGGKGKGGAITAAVFLKEFVEKTPWAHIDIAGPAWCTKSATGTGFGVRTLVEFALNSDAADLAE